MLETPHQLEKWDTRIRPVIAVAALVPFLALAIIPSDFTNLFLIVDMASWSVFLLDFVVRIVLWRKYPTSRAGIFDLSIVVLTFPWYMIPGFSEARFLSALRLARLIKLVVATQMVRRTWKLASRFGALGIWILVSSIFAALVVLNAEPESSGFENFGDAIWWAMVSFTTVGYGDLYPVTALGRFAGLLMMLTGLAALGSVAAILGSTFASQDTSRADSEEQLRRQLENLTEQVAELTLLVRDRESGDQERGG